MVAQAGSATRVACYNPNTVTLEQKERRLEARLREYRRAIVAFSGGVDSSYLAYMASRALGRDAHCVTAVSPAVSGLQLELARGFARRHRLNHREVRTREMEDPNYTSNPSDRCYFCKSELYGLLSGLRTEWGAETILDGSNRDDVADWRPGRQAAAELGVVSPLLESDLTKADIRELSRRRGLASWNLPAMPCLSSRFPYGTEITAEKLRQVERAEAFLWELGLRNFRVRHHDELARLEVDQAEWARMLDSESLRRIDERLRELGYRWVTLDLGGFRSGSLNDLIELSD